MIAESALVDLEAIKEYYDEQGVAEIGVKFVTEILVHAEGLRDNPDIGSVVPEFEEKTIREVIHPPFRMVYLRENSQIHIIRVWRSEQLMKLPC